MFGMHPVIFEKERKRCVRHLPLNRKFSNFVNFLCTHTGSVHRRIRSPHNTRTAGDSGIEKKKKFLFLFLSLSLLLKYFAEKVDRMAGVEDVYIHLDNLQPRLIARCVEDPSKLGDILPVGFGDGRGGGG